MIDEKGEKLETAMRYKMRQVIRLSNLKELEEKQKEETTFLDLLEAIDFRDDLRYK